MNKFDWLALDAHLLQILVMVVETGSITQAAHQLGVTQSAVSHQIDKLRSITSDPLFVKSGRGIVPTAQAERMALKALDLLHQLQQFAHRDAFDPAQWQSVLTIAANDFQRDLLLAPLALRLRHLAPGLALRIIPSTVPPLDLLRSDRCHLAISPRPPEGADIMQVRLFEDKYRVFFDASQRGAPRTQTEYLAADHATVVYDNGLGLELDQKLGAQGLVRRFAVMVPSFSALPAFVRGTPLLATAPSLLAHQTLKGLDTCQPPFPTPKMPMYMIWHVRYQQDAAHRWLRSQVAAVVKPSLKGV